LPAHLTIFHLYEALEIEAPILASAPPVLGPDGNKKLSKRDNAKDVLDYLREGFLPEALVNFITSLGWNDGTEQEIFTTDELIQKFKLEQVQRSGARFDERRLLWMNGTYLRSLSTEKLYELSDKYWPDEANDYPEEYKMQTLALVQERIKYLAELPELTRFFFIDLPVNEALVSENKQLKKLSPEEILNLLDQARVSLEQSDFSEEDLTNRLNQLLESTGQKPMILFGLIRIATTQAQASPALAGTLSVLGKDLSLKRLQTQINAL